MRTSTVCTALGAVLAFAGIPAQADVILDADFFSTIPHTLVTFETDGTGNPVALGQGESAPMPAAEYAALGFTFQPSVKWVNDLWPDLDAAQAIGGSLEIGIPGPGNEDYFILFSVPVRAFGFWAINNNTHPTPIFEAYGIEGLIETVEFKGAAIDGTIGIMDFGFIGIVSEELITRIHVTIESPMLDNFMFSAVAQIRDCNENGVPDEDDAIYAGDFDADDDVDLDDYKALAICLAGPEQTPAPPAEECIEACLAAFDFDWDGDVDLDDVAMFQATFTGFPEP